MPPTFSRWEVWVAISQGEPVNLRMYRHTSIWYVDRQTDQAFFFHAVRRMGFLRIEMVEGFDITYLQSIEDKFQVGTTVVRKRRGDISSLMGLVDVPLASPGFDSYSTTPFLG
ncbi:hypothetical protein GMORB2_7500 [Geosmithia morbida]|uniref:Uncharacterized protein n=1 Tax=Geosmithia morbida TaxID=1094350 RepID=A0A9P5D099_9HYPO|nr:uncharacterized protein GMORB2_7500 [Geosmithia morbida]KAF4122508.1 hypothetical protein GMORB2_7500 [Geosmithia morbida]